MTPLEALLELLERVGAGKRGSGADKRSGTERVAR